MARGDVLVNAKTSPRHIRFQKRLSPYSRNGRTARMQILGVAKTTVSFSLRDEHLRHASAGATEPEPTRWRVRLP